jgi:hypothetical protein
LAKANNRDASESQWRGVDRQFEETFGTGYLDRWQVAQASELAINWNKLFPYQLLLLKRNEEGKWSKTSFGPPPVTLPIPPQTLNIDMPFAMTVEATQGGVIEQANGAPFRDISLQGTTGVLPLRNTTAKPAILNPLQGIFLGTSNTILGAANTVTTVKNAVGVGDSTPPNVIPETDFASKADNSPAFGTGYYQFLLLKRFLEWYAEAKKGSSYRNITLGFAVYKEQEVYLVTPQAFSVARSASQPLSYQYSLKLRAWGRVVLSEGAVGGQAHHKFVGRDPNLYARVGNALDAARTAMSLARNTITSFAGDLNNLIETNVRKAQLFVSDATGTSVMGHQIAPGLIPELKTPLLTAIAEGRFSFLTADNYNLVVPLAGGVNWPMVDLLAELSKLANEEAEQKSSGRVGQQTTVLNNKRSSSPALSVFTDPPLEFWKYVSLDALVLKPSTIRNIQNALDEVRNLRRGDFEDFRDEMLRAIANYEQAVGVGDSTVMATLGVPVRPQVREVTDQDWDVLFAMQQIAQQYDAMAASSSIDARPAVSVMDVMAGFADRSGVAFTRPTSKFLVPVPYGYTLEQLANQYLGNPDRWMEIATLNGLRTPYIDETGWMQDFATNGVGNQFSVVDASRYFVNQTVWLSALGVKREKRRITKIQQLGPSLALVTVNGQANLDRFKLSNEAFVHAFLPGTTNSLQYIYIPSDAPADEDWITKSIPGVDTLDPLFTVGGVDLMLDTAGDLVITPDGSTRLSSGLHNLIQRLRIAIGTPRGSLFRHPDFGFGIKVGSSTADVSAQDILIAAKQFVKDEEGFTGVQYAAVRKVANGLTLSMSVGIEGVNKNVPVTIDLR